MNPNLTVYPVPGFSQPFSSLSHLLGAGVFAVLGVLLVRRGRAGNRIWLTVFVVSAVFLLSMSGVYHLLTVDSFAREEVFRRLDHAAIFVLIAGTFTAGHGILFTGWWRWGVICLLWVGAAAAITLKSLYFGAIPELLGLGLYLGFGWLGLISGCKLWRDYGFGLIRPLLWGGLAYTLGAVAEINSQALWIPGVFGAHEFFHLAVLAGLGFHFQFLWRIADWHPGQGARPAGAEVWADNPA